MKTELTQDKPKRGRPVTGRMENIITVTLPDDLYAELMEEAERMDRPLAWYVRYLLKIRKGE
jgi:hypothetical protein